MATVEGFDFFPLHFDGNGTLTAPAELDALTSHIASAGSTDLVTIAHGFRNSEREANGLSAEFLKNFGSHLARPELAALAPRRFVVAGVFWPSKAFPEGPQDKDRGHPERRPMRPASGRSWRLNFGTCSTTTPRPLRRRRCGRRCGCSTTSSQTPRPRTSS